MGCIDWEVKGTFDNSMIFPGPNLGRKLPFPRHLPDRMDIRLSKGAITNFHPLVCQRFSTQ